MLVFFFAIVSALLAVFVAIVELLTRYRDDPFGIVFGSRFSWAYFLFNGVIGSIAFLLLWGLQVNVTIGERATADKAGKAPAGAVAPPGQEDTSPGGAARSANGEPKAGEPKAGEPKAGEPHGKKENEEPPKAKRVPRLPSAKTREELLRLNQDGLVFVAQVTDDETPAEEAPAEVTPAEEPATEVGSGTTPTETVEEPTVGAATSLQILFYYALAAGFGGALILRSRFITVRSGSQDVAIGPSVVMDKFLFVLDREIDRCRAIVRMNKVRDVMHGIDYIEAKLHAVNMIVNGLQNMTAEEREELTQQIQAMAGNENLADHPQEKSYVLGYLIMNIMGEEFLDALFGGEHKEPFKMTEATLEDATLRTRDERIQAIFNDVRFAKVKQRFEQKDVQDALGDEREQLNSRVEEIAANEQKPTDEEKNLALAFAVIQAKNVEFLETHFKDLR